VAEHDLVSEVYRVTSGSATLVLGPVDDHIDYLMVRFDPDKVTPLKDEAASRTYLSKPASGQ